MKVKSESEVTQSCLTLRDLIDFSLPGSSVHGIFWLWHHLKLLPREGNGTPLQYFYLENPVDGGAWWAAVHGVAKSQTQLSD